MNPRLALVLAAIDRHWHDYSVPPTVRYVKERAKIPSNSTVHYYYRQLAQAGKIIMAGSPGSRPKPVPVSLFKLIKESTSHE